MNWKNWTLKQKIGQLVVVRASGFLFDHQIRYPVWEASNATLRRWLETLNLGGVILLGGSAAELATRTQQLQAWSSNPLLISADIEEGVGQRFSGATWFPPPMALNAIAEKDLPLAQGYAAKMGEITVQEALAMGINWVLAPIADVNNNAENPVINIRAFGETPEIVSALVTSFIQGSQEYPVLTTAKHFPGHGDTATDSHLHLPIIPHSLDRLEQVELPPFQAAIAAGVDSVMTAHIRVSAWDEANPATLSPAILTGQLREKMGFNGLIVTDALIMGGVVQEATPEEVAVRALIAGADILLMPPDPETAIAAVYEAVQSGRLTEARIDESVQRIWQAKEKLGLFPSTQTGLALENLSTPTAREAVALITEHSLQIGGNLPLKVDNQQPKRNLIVVDDLLNCDFLDRACPSVVIPKRFGYQVQLRDQNTLDSQFTEETLTLLQVFIRGNPFRGTAGLTARAQEFYQQLIKTNQVQAVMIYGSPYVLEWFKTLFPAEMPWIFSYGQMPQSQAITCEKLFELSKLTGKDSDVFI
ncbi:MAG: glycoside hydrolase family 3 N-terminal domain-containing protein [Snowella sp.]|nr:glycoside hydrolase family 3 N-terminal domain-containing protein [Snowella sp.]